MRFKKIVGFGDSWMWGDELIDPALRNRPDIHAVDHENTLYRESNCFLGLLGQHYNLPTENFAIPGGSLHSTVWNYIWWTRNESLPLKECMVLVGLTNADRMSFYNPFHCNSANSPPWNKYVHSSWVDAGVYSEEWTQVIKQIMVLAMDDQTADLNFSEKVMFFQGQHALHKNLIQFTTLGYYPLTVQHAPNLINSNGSLLDLLINVADPKSLFAPKRHPNENGHKMIAQYLIPYVDSCIINGC